jgi:hypothetical protein
VPIVSRIKCVIPIVLMVASTVVFAGEQVREFSLRGWVFEIPSFLVQKVQQGPDFTVTYFSSGERKMSLGIYDGTSPQKFAKGKAEVREEKDQIGGQKVTWSLWEEGKGRERSFHAELSLLIKTASDQTAKFRVFATAASAADLDLLRRSVRTGRGRATANQPRLPKSGVHPAACWTSAPRRGCAERLAS